MLARLSCSWVFLWVFTKNRRVAAIFRTIHLSQWVTSTSAWLLLIAPPFKNQMHNLIVFYMTVTTFHCSVKQAAGPLFHIITRDLKGHQQTHWNWSSWCSKSTGKLHLKKEKKDQTLQWIDSTITLPPWDENCIQNLRNSVFENPGHTANLYKLYYSKMKIICTFVAWGLYNPYMRHLVMRWQPQTDE